MPIQWMFALQNGLLALVIPAAIIIGHRVRGGPLFVIGGGALLAFLIFWLSVLDGASSDYAITVFYVFLGGMLWLLGAWALALADAARERRWVWVALLSFAVYFTVVALLAALLSPYAACLFGSQQPYCVSANQNEQTLLRVGSFIAPVVIMLYALRASVLRRDAPPAGLSASHLSDAPNAEPGDEPVAEPGSL